MEDPRETTEGVLKYLNPSSYNVFGFDEELWHHISTVDLESASPAIMLGLFSKDPSIKSISRPGKLHEDLLDSTFS